MRLGTGIGLNSNITSLPLPFEEDISMRLGTRSGLSLLDDSGNNASILLPYFDKISNDTSIILYTSDSTGLLDVCNYTSFTVGGFFCPNAADNKTALRFLIGKGAGGMVAGMYYIAQSITTGELIARFKTGSTNYIISSGVDYTTLGWSFIHLTFNNSTKIAKLYINGTQYGGDVSYSSSFVAVSSAYEFMIGGANSADGANNLFYPLASSISDCYVFPFELSPTQVTSIINRESLEGALAHWSFSGNFLDSSGNNKHLTTVGVIPELMIKYSEYGSRIMLDKGYSIWKRADSEDKYVPYLDTKIPMVSTDLPTGYSKYMDYPGEATKLKLALCKLKFTNSLWDRSDATKYNLLCRNVNAYVAASPLEWHISELNQFTINNYCLDSFKGTNFVKVTSNSLDNRHELLEIISYSTAKTGADYDKVLIYTRDYAAMPEELVLDYYYTATDEGYHATRENKILKFNDTTKLLSLSLDGGDTFSKTLDLTGVVTQLDFAHIFSEGNILFCSPTKAYYSTDNLDSYQESTTLGIDGNTFVPSTCENFRAGGRDKFITIDGQEHVIFGNYALTVGGAVDTNTNIWDSTDGSTIRSIYKADTTLVDTTPVSARHIHCATFNELDNTLWICTGDAANKCNIIKGIHNIELNSWSYTMIWKGTTTTLSKIGGLLIKDNYFYINTDVDQRIQINGTYKVPYDGITDTTKWVNLFPRQLLGQLGAIYNNGIYIFSIDGGKNLLISKDGKYFFFKTLTGGETGPSSKGVFFAGTSPNTDGYFRFYAISLAESNVFADWTKGQTLMLKVS